MSKSRSVSRRRGHSSATDKSSESPAVVFTPEEQLVENEIKRRVRLVVLAGGAGSEFGLKWKTVSLNGAGRGLKTKPGEESDAYVSEFSDDGDISFSAAKVRQIATEHQLVNPTAKKNARASAASAATAAFLDDERDESTVVPILGSWVVALKRELSLSSKTHSKLVVSERRMLVLDDENKVLYVCSKDSLINAKAIPYTSLEAIRGHYGADGVFYISIQMKINRRVRRGEKSKMMYFRTVRVSRPFQPDYAVSAMVRWVAALRYRGRLYDTTTWNEQDQAKHAALAIQHAFRAKKAKVKRAELREFMKQQNTLTSRVVSYFRGTAAVDEKRERAISDLFGDDEHGLPSSLSCITPQLKRAQSSIVSIITGTGESDSVVGKERSNSESYGSMASKVTSAVFEDMYTLTGLRRLRGGSVGTIKEEDE